MVLMFPNIISWTIGTLSRRVVRNSCSYVWVGLTLTEVSQKMKDLRNITRTLVLLVLMSECMCTHISVTVNTPELLQEILLIYLKAK